jgi:hypothetical protein
MVFKHLSNSLEEVNRRLFRIGYARVSLVTVLLFAVTVIMARFIYSSITGYILPDEAWYYNNFILANHWPSFYREVFLVVYKIFFLGSGNMQSFLIRGTLYAALWGVGSVLIFYKMMRILDFPDLTAALLMFSLPLFPVYAIMLPTFLTETLGLFLVLFGIYFMVKYFKTGQTLMALLSALFFVMAYKVREPYLLLLVGNLIVVMLCEKRSWKAFIAYALPVAIIVPIPVSLGYPIVFGPPAYAYLVNFLLSLSSLPNGHLLTGSVITLPQGLPGPHFSVLEGLLVGLFFGFNPLFTIFLFVSFGLVAYSLRRKNIGIGSVLLLNMVLAMAGYYVSVMVVVVTLVGALTTWASTVIRYSHTALPSLLGFAYLYKRIRPIRLFGMLFILVVLASVVAPQYTEIMQSSLQRIGPPINRLSLDYRAPYYRLYLIARNSGKTLVVGGLEMRGIVTYMSFLPNVVLVSVPRNETEFRNLINQTKWDSIYLYDDWYTILDPSVQSSYPAYYWTILHSHDYSDFTVHTLWTDPESYAISLVRTNPTSSTST